MKRIFLIAFFGLFLCIGQSFADSINVSEDAYVISGSPTTTYNNTTLTTWLTSTATYTTYLKFDLSSIPSNETITSAALNLYKYSGQGSSGTIAYYVDSDSWSETSLTWNNRPGIGASIGTNSTTGAGSTGWLTWDLTLSPQMLSDQTLSIALNEATSGTNIHYFWSQTGQSGSYKPYLDVQTAPVPIPGAIWLLGSGLIGIVGIRRKLKKT